MRHAPNTIQQSTIVSHALRRATIIMRLLIFRMNWNKLLMMLTI
jgi:hypothetical protein